ncbi:E3 binding domain-containing protein, partial [Halalkalicoccus jeotgali]
MGYVVKMPKLGLEMERGTLLEWHIGEDDPVEEGDVIAEIESEKSIGEIEAREDGVLRLIDLEEGETVPPGTPIGIVAGAEEDIGSLTEEFEDGEQAASAESADSGDTAEPAEPEEPVEATADADGTTSATSSSQQTGEKPKASPRAERRASELDVALATIEGSGPGGAITEDDVEAAASGGESARTATEQVKASPRARRRAEELGVDPSVVEGSGPGGAITEDDVEAAVEDAPATAEPTVTGDERAESRDRYRTATLVVAGETADTLIETTDLAERAFDLETSQLDVLLVAVSAALEAHPAFNGTFADDT